METQKIKLNLIPNYSSFPEVIKLKQYDATDTSNGKSIVFLIYNGDEAFSIPSTATVTIRGTKADKTGYEYECEYSGNKVTAKVQTQMTIFSGKYDAELRISSGNNVVGCASFKIDVQASALSDDTVISDTELPLLEKAIESAEKVVDLEKEIKNKQDILVSGTNIKTVNSQSLLGSGNIEIQGGGSSDYNDLINKPTLNGTELKGDITITTVSEDAKNIATNTANITKKQDTLISGTNIKTINNQSLLGSGNVAVAPVSHATSETTYGVGTTDNYGHNKVINNVKSSSFVNGEALSAYQGKVLKGLIDANTTKITNTVVKVANIGWGTSLSFTYNKVCQCLVLVNGTVYGAIWFPNSVPTLVKTGHATETVTLSYSSSEITLTSSTTAAITAFYI